MVRYETPALIDLNELSGHGGSCGGGSNATWGCTPSGNMAAGGCSSGGSANNWCETGISGALKPPGL